MVESELQARVRERLGLRIEPKMRQYIERRLAESTGPFAVMGGDARTGVPRRMMVEPRLLLDEASGA
jgi:hypothetical protein